MAFNRLARLTTICPRLLYSKPMLTQTRSSTSHGENFPGFENILTKNDIPEEERKQVEKEVDEMTSDWLPRGYNNLDREDDEWRHKMFLYAMFCLMMPGLIITGFSLPETDGRNWGYREAYLELEKRRKRGLPLIDPNFIPEDKIKLPSDDELAHDFKIII